MKEALMWLKIALAVFALLWFGSASEHDARGKGLATAACVLGLVVLEIVPMIVGGR